MSLLQKTRHTG